MQIIRYLSSTGSVLGVAENQQLIGHFPADTTIASLLALPADVLRQHITQAIKAGRTAPLSTQLLAPLDGMTEVWAAGVTYKRSMDARREESETPDVYTKVYTAERPELFFKAQSWRVSGKGQPIAVRTDSTWDVPEPELAIVINTHGDIVGYTIANDVSSRSIEGENPLYLPQAKVYAGSCALGPGITPAWEISDPYNLTIYMSIERAGQPYWQGQTSTTDLKRRLDELAKYLFLEADFPHGAILCTGTALVPDPPFTLQPSDVVEITIDQIGTLRNHVVRGKAAYTSALHV